MSTTTPAASTTLPRLALGDLADRITGRVLTPDARAYADATALFNAAIDNRPDCVVEAHSTSDVVAAVRFARQHGLDLSVKGGGHGVAGLATAGRLVIDLSAMRDVDVNPSASRAWAQGGCTWADVDTATQPYALATPGGRVTHTGIAGLTLGGGQGWLSPKHGLACDNLMSAEVVTADGQVVTAGARGDEELLWALRGGGGNFGVVTRFEYQLHEVGPTVLAGVLVHPLPLAAEVFAHYQALVDTAGPNLGGAIVVASAPDAPFVPRDAVGALVVVATLAWFGDISEGERVLAPLGELGPPVADLVEPMPYTLLQTLTDAPNPRGMRNYWSAAYLSQLQADVVQTVIDTAKAKQSPLTAMVVLQMGEAVTAVSEDATAFPHRDARWLIHPMAMWADRGHDDAEIAWAHDARARLEPFASGGTYLNTDSAHADTRRVRDAFGATTYEHLAAVKATYDPDNVFHNAPNIAPRVSSDSRRS